MKTALLSNVTVDFLAETLRKNIDVYVPAGFNTWQQEIYSENSDLYLFKPDTVVVLLYASAYVGAWEERKSGEYVISEWMNAIRALSTCLPGIQIFISDIDVDSVHCCYGAEKRLERYFENKLIHEIERLHDEGALVYVLPVKDTAATIGYKSFYSAKMWYMGSMPYGMKGITGLNDLILTYVSVTKGRRKKCIAVDLDNTIWGGIIGEDGVTGIALSDHKEGARYKDTQRILKKMKDEGVMLAILSKNNPEDVELAMSHPDMVLKHEDFVAEVVNWEPKPENIRNLADTLNIGLDSFVFFDDNPAEREQMKSMCPEVAVIDFPKDTSLLPDTVEKAYKEYFFALEVSGEDLRKTDMYRSEVLRKEEQKNAGSLTDYLKNLDMAITVHDMKPEEESRVTQLVNKTNQFNLTTVRCSEAEIHAMANDDDVDVITVHMSDKYGDQGLVSVIIIRYEGAVAAIDTFLMSCRVMGRTAEDVIMRAVIQKASKRECTKVRGTFIKTAKNKPVEDLYDRLGFTLLGAQGDAGENGYRKDYEIGITDLAGVDNVFNAVCLFEN